MLLCVIALLASACGSPWGTVYSGPVALSVGSEHVTDQRTVAVMRAGDRLTMDGLGCGLTADVTGDRADVPRQACGAMTVTGGLVEVDGPMLTFVLRVEKDGDAGTWTGRMVER